LAFLGHFTGLLLGPLTKAQVIPNLEIDGMTKTSYMPNNSKTEKDKTYTHGIDLDSEAYYLLNEEADIREKAMNATASELIKEYCSPEARDAAKRKAIARQRLKDARTKTAVQPNDTKGGIFVTTQGPEVENGRTAEVQPVSKPPEVPPLDEGKKTDTDIKTEGLTGSSTQITKGSKKPKLTSDAKQKIREIWDSGEHDYVNIAKEVGFDRRTVYVYIYHSIEKRGKKQNQAKTALTPQPTSIMIPPQKSSL
jgi:hypothetical protein